MRRLLWILIVLAVLSGIWWATRPKPTAVDIAVITRGTIRETMNEQGRTRAQEIYRVSAPVQGRLMRVGLSEGDAVEADKVIAHIDPLPIRSRAEEMQAEIRALKSRLEGVATKKPKSQEIERAKVLESTARKNLEAAEQEHKELTIQAEQAGRELERLRELRRDQRISISEFEASQLAATRATQAVKAHDARLRVLELGISIASLERSMLEARQQDYDWEEQVYREQVAGLEATLRSITADLERTKITAPIDGVVLTIHRESEQVLQAGEAILELADLGKLEVEAEFLSQDAAHMRQGMEAEIHGRALGDRILSGRVVRIEPRAFEKQSSLGVEQQRVHVIIAFDPAGTGLRDQYRVQVRVILQVKKAVLLVPEGALFREHGRWFVFRVEDGRARRVEVSTGIRDARQREVTSGLAEGDRVILYPGDELQESDPVESLPSETVR